MEIGIETIKTLIQYYGYPLLFLAVTLESLPFIGMSIPGGVIAVGAGAILARLGILDPWTTYLLCIGAALLIDNIGYLTGQITSKKKFHQLVRYFFIKQELLDRLHGLSHCHTGKTIILGRINPLTRPIVPFVMGNEKVPYKTFIGWASISATLWTSIFYTIGYLFAETLTQTDNINMIILATATFLILGTYLYYITKNFYQRKKGGFLEDGTHCKK